MLLKNDNYAIKALKPWRVILKLIKEIKAELFSMNMEVNVLTPRRKTLLTGKSAVAGSETPNLSQTAEGEPEKKSPKDGGDLVVEREVREQSQDGGDHVVTGGKRETQPPSWGIAPPPNAPWWAVPSTPTTPWRAVPATPVQPPGRRGFAPRNPACGGRGPGPGPAYGGHVFATARGRDTASSHHGNRHRPPRRSAP